MTPLSVSLSEQNVPNRRLPTFPGQFIGREGELEAAYLQMLEGGERLLTVTGPGGVGKTHFTLELARKLEGRFLQGALWVECAELSDPKALSTQILLSLEKTPGNTPDRQLERALQGQHLLLILDNLEQIPGVALPLESLLGRCSDLTVIATSRGALGTAWERCYPLVPLECPPLGMVRPEAVLESEAVRLFVARARRVLPGYWLDEAELPVLAQLMGALDGLPLAIELAAAQMPYFNLTKLLERIRSGQALPASSAHRGRQRTLEDNLAWGYALLSSEQQNLLLHLGLLQGRFERALLEAFELPDSDEHLSALLERGWLSGSEAGYRLLETVRVYALQQARESSLDAQVYPRLLEHLSRLALAQIPLLGGESTQEALHSLGGLWLHLNYVLNWACAHGQATQTVQALYPLTNWWLNSPHARPAVALLENALEQAELDLELDIQVHISLANNLLFTDNFLAAEKVLCRAQAKLVGQTVSPKKLVYLEITWGALAESQGRLGDAKRCYELALPKAQALNNPLFEHLCLFSLSRVLIFKHQPREAITHLDRSLQLVSPETYPLAFQTTLIDLGRAHSHAQDYETAEVLIRRSLDYAQKIDAPKAQAMCRSNLGELYLVTNPTQARLELTESLTLGRTYQLSGLVVAAETGLGWLALQNHDVPEGKVHLIAALEAAATLDGLDNLVLPLLGLCAVETQQGDTVRAAELLGATDALTQSVFCFITPVLNAPIQEMREALSTPKLSAAYQHGAELGHVVLLERYGISLSLAKAVSTPPPKPKPHLLSFREREVLSLLAQGLTNRQMAVQLELSPATIDTHLRRLFAKLEVRTRAQAVSRATELGTP